MKSIIIGAGTYGQVYSVYLQEAGVEVVGFLDDDKSLWNTNVCDIPVLGGIEKLSSLRNELKVEAIYCPIGNNPVRVRFLEKAATLGYETPSFIHPAVLLPPSVIIGKGVYILPGTSIMPFVEIDDYVMMSIGINIAHHCRLCKGVFLSNGVNMGGTILIEEEAYVGVGATIMAGVERIGKHCLIGAGTVVTKNIPDNAVAAGVPARILRYKN